MSHSGMSDMTAKEYQKTLESNTKCYPIPLLPTQLGFKTALYLFTVQNKDTKDLERVVGYFYIHPRISAEINFSFSNSTLLPSHYNLINYTLIGYA